MAGLHPALDEFAPLEERSFHGAHARHRVLLARSKAGTLVAIQILAQVPIPEEIRSRLSRSASTTARLTHESIVQPRALVLETDLAAVVTEFVPGVSLQRLLRFASSRGVRLPDEVAWYILSRVLAALAFAHESSSDEAHVLVHGNVSPASVVVGWDGTTKVTDFGGSKLRALVSPLLPRENGESMDLVAPEVASGSESSIASDVFGAGLLALRLATGRTPYARYRDSAAQLMIAMGEGELTKLSKLRPDLPAPLTAIFDQALEIDPIERVVTARAMLDAVNAAFAPDLGKDATGVLIGRWREQLEKSVTPWEARGSNVDMEKSEGEAPPSREHEPQLALTTPDDRPSAPSLVTSGVPDEPWNKDRVPADEAAYAPTGAQQSFSRVGATSADAFTMPPLPAIRIAAPSLPVYGGPAVNIPRPKSALFRGRIAAISMIVLFAMLAAGAYFILRNLSAHVGP